MSDVVETPALGVAVVDVDGGVGRANFSVTSAVAADIVDKAGDDVNVDVVVLLAEFCISVALTNVSQLLTHLVDWHELDALVLLIAVVRDAFVLLLMAIFMWFAELLIIYFDFIVCPLAFAEEFIISHLIF